MKTEKFISSWSKIMFLLPILIPLFSLLLQLPLWLNITILTASFLILIQIAKFWINTGHKEMIDNIFLGTAIALMSLVGFPGLTKIPIIIWALLFLSLLIQFIARIYKRAESKKHLKFKIILLAALTLPLLGMYAHFGKTTIWVMIIAFCLVIFSKKRTYAKDLNWLWTKNWLLLISLFIGLISTLIQFRQVTILFGLKLIPFVGLSLLSLILFAVICLLIYHAFIVIKRNKTLKKYQAESEREKREQEERSNKMEKAKQEKEKEKTEFLDKILRGNLDEYYKNITISNVKKQIVWGPPLHEALIMARQIIDSSFIDQELIQTRFFLKKILEKIEKEKKGNKQEYLGEKELREKIEHLISLIPE
jgi:ABC-type multidrug transport system fused ATPase/permease subunit